MVEKVKKKITKKKEDMLFLKNIKWQDISLVIITLFIFLYSFNVFYNFKELPGPLYGGDIYYHFGHTNHLYNGGGIFESSHFLNEYEHYPWFMHLTIAYTAKLFNASPLKTSNVIVGFFIIIAALLSYYLANRLFNNKSISLLFAVFWICSFIPTPQPGGFAIFIMINLSLFFIFFSHNLKEYILAGIFFGLASLTYVGAFFGSVFFIIILFISNILKKHVKIENFKIIVFDKSKFVNTIKEQMNKFLPIGIIGVAIALLYWWPLLFVYKGATPNAWQNYVALGVNPSVLLINLIKSIVNFFFTFDNITSGLLSILSIMGLIVSIKFKKKFRFINLVVLMIFVGLFHVIITQPLFGFNLGYYSFYNFFLLLRALFVTTAIYFIYKNLPKRFREIIIFVSLILVISMFLVNFNDWKGSSYQKNALEDNPLMDAQFQFAELINDISDKNDVFLTTHGETAFALNALTGRKILHMRRTHASQFIDINKRIADAAIIIYGKNNSLRKELISEYNIEYFYVDYYSIKNEDECLKYWSQFTKKGFGDASYVCLQTSTKYKDYLRRNGIEYAEVVTRLDPASSMAPKFDMLAIKPTKVLLNLTIIQEVKSGNMTIFGLYKIN